MNIIVTGASRGLGFETAKALSCSGEHHVIAISRNLEGLKKLEKDCLDTGPGARITVIPLDLTTSFKMGFDFLNLFRLYAETVDILIHNAGMLLKGPFTDASYFDALSVFNTNFFAAAFLTRGVLPMMPEHSHVLSIGSMGGYQGSAKFPGLAYYSASKGALAIWTECMAEEMKERKISFNCLAIGSVQTEMLEQAFPGYKAPLAAAELARFVSDFALNGHRYFNGKVLPVSLSTP